MSEIKIEIKKRNIDFGIVTWPYALDFEVKTMFNQDPIITLDLGGGLLKRRKVSYRYRRFSLGKKRIATAAGKKKYFVLTKEKGIIKISFK